MSHSSKMHLTPSGLGCWPFLGAGSIVVDLLFIVAPIVDVFCLVLNLLYSTLCLLSFAIILVGKGKLGFFT